MIKVSVLYPNTEGKKFDIDYYCNHHMALCKEKLGDALKGAAVDEGLPGAPYVAIGHLLFDSVEAFQAAFGPHAEVISADLSNYTDIEPTIQINIVKM